MFESNLLKMRCTLIFVLSVLSLACAAPPRSDNENLSYFLRYVETIRGIQIHNMLVVTVKFVEQVVNSVPVEHRGPGSHVLETFANRGRALQQRGSTAEKYVYIYDLQEVFEGLKNNLSQSSPESQKIGMSIIGLLGVASEFAKEDEMVHNKFVEGATRLKTKVSPATIARESELFNAVNKYVTSSDVQQHETLIEDVLRFKNRY
ncbi:uncharacterized protein [Drosophila takahashii]|uniref:uncharacterized protein n=1 Tax=Drosophila takahashii TaxID=29030 RepID=UPI001CF88542|nr:uncharacterized protein LOC108055412 [Drosophila takahashii]